MATKRSQAPNRRETALDPILSHARWGLLALPVLSACVFASLFLAPVIEAWRRDAGAGTEMMEFAAVRFAFFVSRLGMWVVALGLVGPVFAEIGARRMPHPARSRERALWLVALAVVCAGVFYLTCLAFASVVTLQARGDRPGSEAAVGSAIISPAEPGDSLAAPPTDGEDGPR